MSAEAVDVAGPSVPVLTLGTFPASADLTPAQRVYAGEKPARKPRAPSKKLREIEQAAYLRGFDAALRSQSAWPGAVAALLLAAFAFGAGAWFL